MRPNRQTLIAAAGVLIAALASRGQSPPPAAKAAEKPSKDLAALERKLHGEWDSKLDCVGEIAVRADGTFERRHYSPGNNTLAGTWGIRWDALPPTLVLACKTSDDKDAVGRAVEYKLVLLDDGAFSIQYGKETPLRYEKAKK